MVTISVDDMEATLKRIHEVGGKVIAGKTQFGNPPRGYTAYFRDTEGNLMGLEDNPRV